MHILIINKKTNRIGGGIAVAMVEETRPEELKKRRHAAVSQAPAVVAILLAGEERRDVTCSSIPENVVLGNRAKALSSSSWQQ